MSLPKKKPLIEPVEAKEAPRERILKVAQEMFYRRGVHVVTVDNIASAAGTNKMTLYYHFPSKHILIAECLRVFGQAFEADWDAVAQPYKDDPRGQLEAWLGYFVEYLTKDGGRGCALANVAIELAEKEHPARQVVEEIKTAQYEKMVELCGKAGYAEPAALADELTLLLEGARVSIQSVGPNGPAARLGGLVKAVLAYHAEA